MDKFGPGRSDKKSMTTRPAATQEKQHESKPACLELIHAGLARLNFG
jgi:hypothetical protein